ncbi:MAG: nucleotidyltransferase substrate binding protein, partial [Bacteroidales bacterium]|nr:nucleotidyltransferase substrate binding protein [Bacteroidales bacterium]
MNNSKDIRWRQRFTNFEKAYKQFMEAMEKFSTLSTLEKEGLVQRFEYTFELSWKLMKDYLESKGVSSKFPRDVIKNAFFYEIIENGEVWMDMLEKRNLLAHTYDEKNFDKALSKINEEY